MPTERNHDVGAAGSYNTARRAGDFIFTAGLTPRRADQSIVGSSIEEQTTEVIERLRLVMNQFGATLKNIVQLRVYLSSTDDWDAFDITYGALFAGHPLPARTAIGAQLRPGLLVEIDAIAHTPRI